MSRKHNDSRPGEQLWLGNIREKTFDHRRAPGSPGTYILRDYDRTARIDHEHCIICGNPIIAGDRYRGTVMVGGGYLYVLKEHVICPGDPDDWDDDWGEDSPEQTETQVFQFPTRLPREHRKVA